MRMLSFGLFAAVMAAIVYAVVARQMPAWVLFYFPTINVLTFAIYSHDKSHAERDLRRVSERSLLTLGAAGGWLGGLLARHMFRHKTRKQPFRNYFWGTVLVNLFILLWLSEFGLVIEHHAYDLIMQARSYTR